MFLLWCQWESFVCGFIHLGFVIQVWMSYTIGFDLVKYIIYITETYSMNAAINLSIWKRNNQPVSELYTLFLPYIFLNLWWAEYFSSIG